MRNGTNGEHVKLPNDEFLRVSRQRRLGLEMPKIPGMIRARKPYHVIGIEISIMRFAVRQIADITFYYYYIELIDYMVTGTKRIAGKMPIPRLLSRSRRDIYR